MSSRHSRRLPARWWASELHHPVRSARHSRHGGLHPHLAGNCSLGLRHDYHVARPRPGRREQSKDLGRNRPVRLDWRHPRNFLPIENSRPGFLGYGPGRHLQLVLSLSGCGHRHGRHTHLVRVHGRAADSRRRILRVDSFWRRGHEPDVFGSRAGADFHRAGNLLDFHLHPRRLPAASCHQQRILAQIFPVGVIRHRLFSLRSGIDVRRHRFHQYPGDRGHATVRPGAPACICWGGLDVRRPRLQGGGRSLPCLDARRLRRRPGSGRRLHVDRAQSSGLRGASPDHV